jgi:hypothetical protein
MKRSVYFLVAVTAVIAFSLGYFLRGADEQPTNMPEHSLALTAPELSESPSTQTQTLVSADPAGSKGAPSAISDHAEVITSTRSTPRAAYVANIQRRLGDFFLINGIGADREEQIIQNLVEADSYISQKANAMIDHRAAENAELIARGEVVEISRTAEEQAEIESEQEKLYRQVFGEHYEAYETYRRSYLQRRRVDSFSSSLQEPLEYAARETLVQIMYEEHSRSVTEPESESAGSGADLEGISQERVAENDKHHSRLIAMRSFNDRVLDRARAYLTPSQFQQLQSLLDNEIRRTELLIEMAEIEQPL